MGVDEPLNGRQKVQEDTVHLLADQKRLGDKYKDTDMLPKVKRLTWQEQWRPLKSTSDPVMML